MKKYFLLCLAFCFSALISCSGQEQIIDGDPDNPNGKLEVVTDLSKCHRGPLPASIEGNWKAEMVAGSLEVTMTFEFYRDVVRLINVCQLDGVAISVDVESGYYNYGRHLRILEGSSDRKSYRDGDIRLNCSAQLSAGVTEYSFVGQCLKLYAPGKEPLMLVPVD